MKVGNYNLQPIVLFLPENPERLENCRNHLNQNGIDNCIEVAGIHAETFGIQATRSFKRDNNESNFLPEPKRIGCYLSRYMTYVVMQSHTEVEHWFNIEDDVKFLDGWQNSLQQAMQDVPEDFDILFAGSCCIKDRETSHIKGNVYQVKYPLCGHAMIIAKKCLPLLISSCRDACCPMDIFLFDFVFDKLKVYTILPRVAEQFNTELPE